ncbi:hypothetical protein [Leisingera sp. McT4-56]|uniref:hypothetical protein n=1 Tax=Leisingera sp. McT4-56 TaxID=2881255 RepID=UPI001CF8EC0E|nr:hypothetical protein [Leisingera sp. McT4-56]MCB4457204.1 hypothetical protein [Leisingera sp. McT4-56]
MQDSTFFQAQLARIKQSGGLGTLVYLGIGNVGPEAAKACLDSGAKHILLTEADPGRAAALRPMCAAAGAQLRETAVADAAGQCPFYIFNFRSLSSCRRPSGLNKIFPGLRLSDTVQVKTEPLSSLLDIPERSAAGPGLLAVNCPGQEAAILRQLLDLEQLGGFRYLCLSLPADALYEDSLPMDETLQLLLEAGWRLLHTGNQDPDFPTCFLELDPLALQIAELEKELTAAHAAVEAETQRRAKDLDEAASARRRAAAETEKLAARVAELEAENRRQAQDLEDAASARSRAEAEAKKLAARMAELEAENRRQAQDLEDAASARSRAEAEAEKLAARMAELEAENRRQAQDLEDAASARSRAEAEAEKLAARMAELEAENRRQAQDLEDTASARSRAEAEAEEQAARMAELEAENRRLAEDLDETASARSSTKTEAEKLAARVAQLEAQTSAGSEARQAAKDKAAAAGAEARQAQQSLAVALRLQSRREADLKELQKRYSALLQRQEAQEDLLRRTGACLSHLMDDSAPEEARPVLAAAAVLRSGSGA